MKRKVFPILFLALLLFVLSIFLYKKGFLAFLKGSDTSLDARVDILPKAYDLGEVYINGGIVSKEYVIENKGDSPIKVKRISTSCMCTQAKMLLGEKESRFFGMEMYGDKNPLLNWEIAPGQRAKIIVDFDPAFHGPSGIGDFERIVWLTFSDPVGIRELKLSGKVIP